MSRPGRPGVRLRLPATSANLGPGFDALGLALTLYLEIEASKADTFAIDASGRSAEVCGSLTNNLILMTYTEILGSLGLAAPPLALRLRNEIPLGMGCGSSAAALVAGVLLARHFGDLAWQTQQVIDEAARREGHPDNVAACVLGGLTVSATAEDHTCALNCGGNPSWRLLLAVPPAPLSTANARAVLPDTYSRADAVFNVQRSTLLVAAFQAGRPDLLAIAMQDRLHEPYRASLCPLFSRLKALAGTPGVFGVALSGAGPAVLLIVEDGFDQAAVERAAGDEISELLELRIAPSALTEAS